MEIIKCLLIDEWIKKMWEIYICIYGFPGGSVNKEFTCNAEDADSIPGSRKSPGEGCANPLWYSCLENIMDWSYSPWGRRVRHDLSDWACTMEYYSALRKKEILSFTTTWMKLEDIMLSEVSQTQKDKSCMVSLIWGVKKTKSQQQTQNAELILTGNSMMVAAAAAAAKSLVAAAKSLQLCSTLCDPIDGSPPGSAVPGILQARTLEWVAISFSNAWKWKVKVKSLSRVWPSATPWTTAFQAPPSMGFSRQEHWSGVPLPSPAKSLTRS